MKMAFKSSPCNFSTPRKSSMVLKSEHFDFDRSTSSVNTCELYTDFWLRLNSVKFSESDIERFFQF